MKKYKNKPTVLNIVISVISIFLALFFLNQCRLSNTLWQKLLFGILFGLVNNTIFSLLHESVHGSFSKNRTINDWFGRITAAFFPTSFTLQQIFHLGHHKRNRTDAELFDQYYDGDNKLIKKFVIYSLLIGLYWPSSPLANLVFLFCPWLFNIKNLRKNDLMKKASFDQMLSGLDKKNAPHFKIRLEIIFSICIQALIIYLLKIDFSTWFICYWSFALLWSSLQYTDHAWSIRDIRTGAWNLKVSRITHIIWLNYHYHLNHHRSPSTSWLYLPYLTEKNDQNPSFWKIYFKLWKGPTKVDQKNPECSIELENEIFSGTSIQEYRNSPSN